MYVPTPKDLTKIKTKLVLNLDKRQLICFGTGAVIGVPTYLFTKQIIGSSAAVLLMVGLMLPFFFFGIFEKDGLPAEIILRNIIRVKLWPAKRPYKTENLYRYISENENKNKDKNKDEGGYAHAIQRNAKAGTSGASHTVGAGKQKGFKDISAG